MNTLLAKPKALPSNRGLVLILALLLVSMLLPACGKKCQQVTTPFKYLSDTPWRLAETTDPSKTFRALNNYTFPVFSFTLNFRGDVKTVINNEQFDSALCNLAYQVDPGGNAVKIKFSEGAGATPNQGADPNQTTSLPNCPFKDTIGYTYKVGRSLELTDQKSGNYYRFVPFLGIIQPDDVCTF